MPLWLTKTYLVGADLAAITAAMSLAYLLRGTVPQAVTEHDAQHHLQLATLVLPIWIAIFSYYRLYSARFLTTRLEEFRA